MLVFTQIVYAFLEAMVANLMTHPESRIFSLLSKIFSSLFGNLSMIVFLFSLDPCYAAFHDEEWGVPVHDDKCVTL